MKRVAALALITFKEGIRNRSLFGILFFSLFILGLNVAVAGFFMREIGKVTVDMNLSALSFSGLLLVLFVGVNLMAKDIDRKTIHLVLSKPISRIEYLWGKYLGIVWFVLVSLSVLLAFSSVTVFGIKSLYPAYFESFSWLIFYQACIFIFIKLAVLTAIVVFFSAITTSSFLTLVLAICSYIVGETIEEVVFYLKSGLGEDAFPASMQRIIDVVSYLFPNFSVFDFKLEAAHGLAIASERLVFSLGYAVVYVSILLVGASMIFSRREFN
jgi:ABC-type transport system involved in multi-copper enzyme maturation permease subunit